MVNPFVQCGTDTIVTVARTVLFGRSRWSVAFALLPASLSARQNLGYRVPLPPPTYRDRPSGQYSYPSTPPHKVPRPGTEYAARRSPQPNARSIPSTTRDISPRRRAGWHTYVCGIALCTIVHDLFCSQNFRFGLFFFGLRQRRDKYHVVRLGARVLGNTRTRQRNVLPDTDHVSG